MFGTSCMGAERSVSGSIAAEDEKSSGFELFSAVDGVAGSEFSGFSAEAELCGVSDGLASAFSEICALLPLFSAVMFFG